ncbi:hypothetical protein OHB12_02770 [Nocardia sp. NBC_01730]|uniref:hypothetical protein n=1 Tax=Nocardia sp. NBC_01730 TaxID=2975998 RepID=UPI002E123FBC|nr:hypothetical protein OHB12_02770 [Nocardia sp. NBC_01730]
MPHRHDPGRPSGIGSPDNAELVAAAHGPQTARLPDAATFFRHRHHDKQDEAGRSLLQLAGLSP